MQTQLLRYLKDLSGQNEDNQIKDEIHKLVDKRIRAIAPCHGAYYANSLEIVDLKNNRTLVYNQDYVHATLVPELSQLTGQDIFAVILIISKEVSDTVKISYQCYGQEYEKNHISLKELLSKKDHDEFSYSFIDIKNKPKRFHPVFHLHSIADIHGMEFLVYLLEKTRNALLWKNYSLFRSLIFKLESELEIAYDQSHGQLKDLLWHHWMVFKRLFNKVQWSLDKVNDYRSATDEEIDNLVFGETIDKETKYLQLRALVRFKENLYSSLVNLGSTFLGVNYGVVGLPLKSYLKDLKVGTRVFIDSKDTTEENNILFDLSVFPDPQTKRTRFVIWKVTSDITGKSSILMAFDQKYIRTFTGRLKEFGQGLLLEWKELQFLKDSDDALKGLMDHLTDQENPHRDTKATVGLDQVENLPIASRDDVLTPDKQRKYVTHELTELFMKRFVSTQEDTTEIKADADVNVMRRFDVVFSSCGQDCHNDHKSRFCSIDEEPPKFRVFTQRPNYRSKELLEENPHLREFNPVIIEGVTRRVPEGFSVTTVYNAGQELLNIPEVLKPHQRWDKGSLYQGFRSGVQSYELTDPYYDTYLVVRGPRTKPKVSGATVIDILSYNDLKEKYGGLEKLNDAYQFTMREDDWLVQLKCFNKPLEDWSEDKVLEFEKKEQVCKVEIFSAGYTFYLDIRSAVYTDYKVLTLGEKNSPKIIPYAHHSKGTSHWFDFNSEQTESIIVGQIKKNNKIYPIEIKDSNHVKLAVELNKTNKSLRGGYYHGSHGLTPIALKANDNGQYHKPDDIRQLETDSLYGGLYEDQIQSDRAKAIFLEQEDLSKALNFNTYQDSFVHQEGVIRDRPYSDYLFKNPYATGSIASGENAYKAFEAFMQTGFAVENHPDAVTNHLSSCKGDLNFSFKDPDSDRVYNLELNRQSLQNKDIFKTIWSSYVLVSKGHVSHYQPAETMPYAMQIELPKRWLQSYQAWVTPRQTDEGWKLIQLEEASDNAWLIDIVELARLEQQSFFGKTEQVEYNSLMLNVCILKNWGFKDLKEIFKVQDYLESNLYPVYPAETVDGSAVDEQKEVTIYTVATASNEEGIRYQAGLFNQRHLFVNARVDLEDSSIKIAIPEGEIDRIKDYIAQRADGVTGYMLSNHRFKTFDIMYGNYTSEEKITVNDSFTELRIDLSHYDAEGIWQFFRHRLKYIQWMYDIEIAPYTRTSVVYPITTEEKLNVSFGFLGMKANGQQTKFSDKVKTSFGFIDIKANKVINYLEYRNFEDKAQISHGFINAYARQVIRYSSYYFGDKANISFGFVTAYPRHAVNYLTYSNYKEEKVNISFGFLSVSNKKD